MKALLVFYDTLFKSHEKHALDMYVWDKECIYPNTF